MYAHMHVTVINQWRADQKNELVGYRIPTSAPQVCYSRGHPGWQLRVH